MSWSYRKSFGSGLFRVNFSKSGVSYSVGVKGARVNIGPKGTYVNPQFPWHQLPKKDKYARSGPTNHTWLPTGSAVPARLGTRSSDRIRCH
jgi:hypothetical protein